MILCDIVTLYIYYILYITYMIYTFLYRQLYVVSSVSLMWFLSTFFFLNFFQSKIKICFPVFYFNSLKKKTLAWFRAVFASIFLMSYNLLQCMVWLKLRLGFFFLKEIHDFLHTFLVKKSIPHVGL